MPIEGVVGRGLRPIGRHIIVEAFGCKRDVLDDPVLLKRILMDAAAKANMEVCGEVFHKFDPEGVTGIVAVKESHISVHTWPEYNYASIDIFTCGNYSDPWKAYDYIVEVLKPRGVQVMELRRGVLRAGG